MKLSHSISLSAAVAALALAAASASAVQIDVTQLGDYGWRSDDTRNTSGTNLIGLTSTNAPAPSPAPSGADDIAIAQQIQFITAPAGSSFGGVVTLDGTTSNSGKSNISVINTSGFAAASALLDNAFTASYLWYGVPNTTTRTLAFKLGIQSTSYGTGVGQSQQTFVASRSGESAWDLVLVHLGPTSDNVWTLDSVDHDSGNWNLFRQAGNGFFAVTPDPTAKTLDDWAADSTYGSLLFGAGANITSVQFGLGSSQRNFVGDLDYLQTSLLNGGDVINFGPAPVPEPATLGVLGIGACMTLIRRRRSAR